MSTQSYQFLLFYIYHVIDDPAGMCAALKTECERLSIGGRVRVSPEGSNGIIGGSSESISQFKDSFSSISGLDANLVHWYQSGLVTSIPHERQMFSSLSVQVTKEVVSLDMKPEMYEKMIAAGSGTYLTPQEFHAMLSSLDKSRSSVTASEASSSASHKQTSQSNIELLDIRNHYEVSIGTFVGDSFVATNPETRQVITST